jgi:2-(1,2-epoxy-1,2-dihydrophenyl)acetyl-CoA isomerase
LRTVCTIIRFGSIVGEGAMSEKISLEYQDRVALLELKRPDAMNAIDMELRRELMTALDQVARDPNVGAVVLTGAGKAFCSGADLKSAAANPDNSVRRTARTLMHDFQPIIETIGRLDKPVIAAVNGAAVGVGMSLVLACDLVIMAKGAYLMAPFLNVGLVPDGGTAWFLVQRMGYARAFEILADAKKLDADRCIALGIANRVSEATMLRADALAWASQLAAKAPLAMALTKRVARLSTTVGLSELLNIEAELQTFLVGTEDSREAIAAFSEKRSPSFRGR